MSKPRSKPDKPARTRAKKTKPDLRGRVRTRPDNQLSDERPKAERVRAATLLLEDGHPGERVADELAATFDITTRQARRYIRKARELMMRHLEREAPAAAATRIRRLARASRGAEKDKDWRAVVAAEKEIGELQGLYVQKTAGTVGGMSPEHAGLIAALALNPYDQQRRLAELEAKARDAEAAAKETPTP